MSLSLSIPRALIRINKGIGILTLGISTTICLFVLLALGETILTDNVLTGLDASSEAVLISALWLYKSFTLSLI